MLWCKFCFKCSELLVLPVLKGRLVLLVPALCLLEPAAFRCFPNNSTQCWTEDSFLCMKVTLKCVHVSFPVMLIDWQVSKSFLGPSSVYHQHRFTVETFSPLSHSNKPVITVQLRSFHISFDGTSYWTFTPTGPSTKCCLVFRLQASSNKHPYMHLINLV